MNNNFFVSKRTEYTPFEKTVTIHEHKAPTDESLRLLKEMQKEARESLIREIDVKTNLFSGSITIWRNPLTMSQKSFTLKFKLNDKVFALTKETKASDAACMSEEGDKVLEAFKNDIAEIIIKSCAQSINIQQDAK